MQERISNVERQWVSDKQILIASKSFNAFTVKGLLYTINHTINPLLVMAVT